jgi:hypothetical protein
MDQLLENAMMSNNLEIEEFNKNVIKNQTNLGRHLGYCWDYTGKWQNEILEWVYTQFKKNITKNMKIIQKCKNRYCVNPEHLVECTYETWFKNTLDNSLAWMDYV